MKHILLPAFLFIGIMAQGQIIQTSHFNGLDTTEALCQIDTARALTIEAWIKNDDSTSSAKHEIFDYFTDSIFMTFESIECFIQHNTITFATTINGHGVVSLIQPIHTNWHHIAITMNVDSSNLFIDGIKVDSQAATYSYLTSTQSILFIGQF